MDTWVGAGRGNPLWRTPTSVVVPPTSNTTASERRVKNAAPRRELTGPDWKVAIGSCNHPLAPSSKLCKLSKWAAATRALALLQRNPQSKPLTLN